MEWFNKSMDHYFNQQYVKLTTMIYMLNFLKYNH